MTSWKISSLTDRVRRAFSEAADQYDILTSLHREIGRELIKRHTALDPRCVIDVGCGTGYLTRKARYFFPEATVIGIDAAPGMLDKAIAQDEAGGIVWLNADAQALPLQDASVDLVVTNLAYQWLEDIQQGFNQVARVLAPQGTFAATIFGYHTCQELFESLDACGFRSNGQIQRLTGIEDLTKNLTAAGFSHSKVDYERISIQFKDLWGLLGWLKAIGANHLPRDGYIGKNLLVKVAAYYQEHFPYNSGIKATFEVIWTEAKR